MMDFIALAIEGSSTHTQNNDDKAGEQLSVIQSPKKLEKCHAMLQAMSSLSFASVLKCNLEQSHLNQRQV